MHNILAFARIQRHQLRFQHPHLTIPPEQYTFEVDIIMGDSIILQVQKNGHEPQHNLGKLCLSPLPILQLPVEKLVLESKLLVVQQDVDLHEIGAEAGFILYPVLDESDQPWVVLQLPHSEPLFGDSRLRDELLESVEFVVGFLLDDGEFPVAAVGVAADVLVGLFELLLDVGVGLGLPHNNVYYLNNGQYKTEMHYVDYHRCITSFQALRVISLIRVSMALIFDGLFSFYLFCCVVGYFFLGLAWFTDELIELSTLMCCVPDSYKAWLGFRNWVSSGRPMITIEMLSVDPRSIDYFRRVSAPFLRKSTEEMFSVTPYRTIFKASLFSRRSHSPSLAMIIISWSVILKLVISGQEITTFGFPPLVGFLASRSPKVRVVDSLPGQTLSGPVNCSSFPPTSEIAVVWQILPPAAIILCCSFMLEGLWSLLI